MSSVILHNGTVPVSNGRALSNDAFVADVNDITGETDKTPSEVASTLSDINSALGAAITAKGGTVASGSTLSDKAEEVGSIPSGGGDPNENLFKFMNNTITYYKNPTANNELGYGCNSRSCAYYSIKNWSKDLYLSNAFLQFGHNQRNFFCAGKVRDMNTRLFYDARISVLVLLTESVNRLSGDLAMERNEAIWVRPSLKSSYKVASNWSRYADNFKGFDEAASYSSDTQYTIGDVCTMNGHFYSYAPEDLQDSTGNAPTGTAVDNYYWEYLAEVNT